MLKWIFNVACGTGGAWLCEYFKLFQYREAYLLGEDINIVGFTVGFFASHFIWKVSFKTPKTESEPKAHTTSEDNPEAVHLTMEPAGFCFKCGHDSLWATILQEEGKEERNLQCTYCDLPPESRTTRSDETIPISPTQPQGVAGNVLGDRKTCQSCKRNIDSQARFCTYCGTLF